MFILTVLLIVYVLAVNFYAFLMMKALKKEEDPVQKVTDGKLALTAALGGAITIYVCMFVFKYRLNNLFLMILMPVLSALNLWLWFVTIRSGFGFLGL
ncbi:MAG: hypothetical protein IJY11_04055 [Clostridia bacterium]|nr:hypothetical protein [Clostridia bacterium]